MKDKILSTLLLVLNRVEVIDGPPDGSVGGEIIPFDILSLKSVQLILVMLLFATLILATLNHRGLKKSLLNN